MANVLLNLLLPALRVANEADDRSVALLDLTRVAAALAVYRAENGEYPQELAALVPNILAEIPVDWYSGDSPLYQLKDDGGYLLYSVFENGADDNGTDLSGEIIKGEWVDETPEDFNYNASDLVIRVPVPEFKLPEPSPEAE